MAKKKLTNASYKMANALLVLSTMYPDRFEQLAPFGKKVWQSGYLYYRDNQTGLVYVIDPARPCKVRQLRDGPWQPVKNSTR